LLDTLEAVEPTVAEWDALAVAARRPYSAPAWLLAWWRNAAPAGSLLRIVAVRDGESLVGIAPFYAYRWRRGPWAYALAGTDITSRIEPLARAGAEADVARLVAETLQSADPHPDLVHLEGVDATSPWPELLRAHWPGGRPWLHHRPSTPAPTVALNADDLDGWLKARSSNFRQQMRRMRRKLEKEGATFRVATTPEEIDRDLAEFVRLHTARWDWRGGSMSMTPGADEMLREAGHALVADGRFRLTSVEVDGRTINCQLHVAAGGEVSYWNGGFDDEYASFKPSLVGLVDAIGDALARGDERFDLGPGAQDYKYRLSDGEDVLEWMTLIPRGRRYARSRAWFAPVQARYAITERMEPEQKQRLRDAIGRVRDRIGR
jgi:CelD/BcsL family acetyltransferase involved in cellulose biosynthesis